MTDQKSKHSIHMIIKLHAKTYPLLTKSNWTNSQTKNQNNHSIKSKSSQTNIHMTKKNNGKTKTFVWKISSKVISFTLKNTFQNDLFQKSNSKKKTENRPHPCNKTVRNPWTLGKKKSEIRQPKVKTCESPPSDTCEPSTPHLITGSFTSKTCAVYLYHRNTSTPLHLPHQKLGYFQSMFLTFFFFFFALIQL